MSSGRRKPPRPNHLFAFTTKQAFAQKPAHDACAWAVPQPGMDRDLGWRAAPFHLDCVASASRRTAFLRHSRSHLRACACHCSSDRSYARSQPGLPQAVLIGLGVLTILWLVRAGRGRTAVLFGVVVAGAEIIDQLGKHLFHRLRPVPFFGLSAPKSYSFPSGHALVSCAFFGALAAIVAARTPSRARRSIYYLAAAAFSGAIGLSRIYLGVHYPSDVLGGYAAAVVWACTVVCVMRRPPVRGT